MGLGVVAALAALGLGVVERSNSRRVNRDRPPFEYIVFFQVGCWSFGDCLDFSVRDFVMSFYPRNWRWKCGEKAGGEEAWGRENCYFN